MMEKQANIWSGLIEERNCLGLFNISSEWSLFCSSINDQVTCKLHKTTPVLVFPVVVHIRSGATASSYHTAPNSVCLLAEHTAERHTLTLSAVPLAE